MMRRSLLAMFVGMVSLGRGRAQEKPEPAFPPVPLWRPSFQQPIGQIIDRIAYYSDRQRDFAVFRHGTCAFLERKLSEAEAEKAALRTLSEIFNYHPDMNPTPMDDGNILVSYNRPAVNVVLHEIALKHWPEIESRHLDGLTTSEVLITPLGPNKFDDFGKQALLGRAYMFMDAQNPEVVQVRRAG